MRFSQLKKSSPASTARDLSEFRFARTLVVRWFRAFLQETRGLPTTFGFPSSAAINLRQKAHAMRNVSAEVVRHRLPHIR